MKKYLFGLGAMLVGAGLMFVFTHTEVSAKDYTPVPKIDCEVFMSDTYNTVTFTYCKIKELTCVSAPNGGLSCVKN